MSHDPYRTAQIDRVVIEDTAMTIIADTVQRIEMHGEEELILRSMAAYFGFRVVAYHVD